MATVVKNYQLANNVFFLEVQLENEEKPLPGEFYMIRSWDNYPLLSRPISVFDYDDDRNVVKFLYEIRGLGTEMLHRIGAGSDITLDGPYGNPFTDLNRSSYCLIGGGVGIAPLLYIAKTIKKHNPEASVRCFLGFTNSVYALDFFYKACDEVNIRVGGYITDILEVRPDDIVFACGPMAMMDKINQIVPAKNDVYMSLEARMACGLGACLGCVTNAPIIYQKIPNSDRNELYATKHVKICTDGPVFKREVV